MLAMLYLLRFEAGFPFRFARDRDRLLRFQRQTILAALNHPNIAQIYGVEESALVMEVEDETLPGGLPVDAALRF
jgi:hypothetical protein